MWIPLWCRCPDGRFWTYRTGCPSAVGGFKHFVASSSGSQGPDQHSGQEEGSGQEAGEEEQRCPGAVQDQGQPEEVGLSAVLRPPLLGFSSLRLKRRLGFPRSEPVTTELGKEEAKERGAPAPVEEPVAPAPPAVREVPAHLRKPEVRGRFQNWLRGWKKNLLSAP